jgi:hypothetical protein
LANSTVQLHTFQLGQFKKYGGLRLKQVREMQPKYQFSHQASHV